MQNAAADSGGAHGPRADDQFLAGDCDLPADHQRFHHSSGSMRDPPADRRAVGKTAGGRGDRAQARADVPLQKFTGGAGAMTRTPRFPLQARVLALARHLWRDLTRDWFDSYRPELHYMRGPGPQMARKARLRAGSRESASPRAPTNAGLGSVAHLLGQRRGRHSGLQDSFHVAILISETF